MPKYYHSLSDDLARWALRQSVFFVASAPLRGQHVNLSPKGLTDASLAVLSPNEAAYIDATGSGSETISHTRENGRLTVMFCSFDTAPRILRLFCRGSVIEWDDPRFAPYVARMGHGEMVGARAIIRLEIFKVQTSCGFGVPLLAVSVDPDTHEPKPLLKTRETLASFSKKVVQKDKLHAYQQEWNAKSLDGLPGLQSALRDNGQSVWWAQVSNWTRRHREDLERLKTFALLVLCGILVLQWCGGGLEWGEGVSLNTFLAGVDK